MLLRLALGALAVGLGALLPASPAAAVAGCEDLLLVAQDERAVRVTVPASLGRIALAADAFRAVRDGQEVPVQARRLAPSEVAVSLLLSGSPSTTPGELDAAQAAMLDLLVNLPAGVRTSLVVGGDPATRVSPLSDDRGAVVRALSRPDLTGSTDAGAGALALQQLPPKTASHLVVFTDGRLPAPVPSRSGTQVHRLDYGSAPVPPAASGCPSGGDVALLPAVDAVVQRVQGSYELVVPAGSTEVRLSVGEQRLSAPLGGGPVPEPEAEPTVEPEAGTAAEPVATTGPGLPVLLAIAFLLPVLAAVVLVRRRQVVAHDGLQPSGPQVHPEGGPPAGGPASPGLLAGLRGRLRRVGAAEPAEVDLAARLARPDRDLAGPGEPGPDVPEPVPGPIVTGPVPGPVVPGPVVPGPVVPGPVVPGPSASRPVVPGLVVSSPLRPAPARPSPVAPAPARPAPTAPAPSAPAPVAPAPTAPAPTAPRPEAADTAGAAVLLRLGELLDAGRPRAVALRVLAGDGQTPTGRQLLRAAAAVDGGADLAEALEATAPRPGAGAGGIRSELGKAAWALRLARSTGARPGLLLKAAARGGEAREAVRRAASQARRATWWVRSSLLVLVPLAVAGRVLLGSRPPRAGLLVASLALAALGGLWVWASTTPPYSPLPLGWRPRAPAPPPPGEVIEDAALWAVINDDVQQSVAAVVADPYSELALTVVRKAGLRVRAGASASEGLRGLADEAWGQLLERRPRPVLASLPALLVCLAPAAVLAVLA